MGISANINSYSRKCMNRKHLIQHMISLRPGSNLSREAFIAAQNPQSALRHLHAQQITELDLGYVVGDVFLFLVSTVFLG